MNPTRSISAIQQLHEHMEAGDPITPFPAIMENLGVVLRLACKGAGLSYPQTGYRGGIVLEGEQPHV